MTATITTLTTICNGCDGRGHVIVPELLGHDVIPGAYECQKCRGTGHIVGWRPSRVRQAVLRIARALKP